MRVVFKTCKQFCFILKSSKSLISFSIEPTTTTNATNTTAVHSSNDTTTVTIMTNATTVGSSPSSTQTSHAFPQETGYKTSELGGGVITIIALLILSALVVSVVIIYKKFFKRRETSPFYNLN